MTEEQKNVVIKRRNSSLGYGAIAKETGLTKDAVVAFCRRNGLVGNMAGKAQEGTSSRCKEYGAALGASRAGYAIYDPVCEKSGIVLRSVLNKGLYGGLVFQAVLFLLFFSA